MLPHDEALRKEAYTLGVDIGASSVKVVALGGETMLWRGRRVHGGDAPRCLASLLDELAAALAGECRGWSLTGSGAVQVVRAGEEASPLEEVPALVLGARELAVGARSIIAIGSQSALFVTDVDVRSRVPRFSMSDGCAAGTGSFFEAQAARLGLSLDDFNGLVSRARTVPRLSGRCAVFAKTDIIHRQQEGVAAADIMLGLCYALVRGYKATVVRDLPVARPVAVAGGIVLNAGVIRSIRDVFGLGAQDLMATEEGVFMQALGAAVHARGGAGGVGLGALRALCHGEERRELPRRDPLPRPLGLRGGGSGTGLRAGECRPTAPTSCALGIDVGSTSTDLVLVDADGRLLDAQYLRTGGDPKAAVREGLASLGERLAGLVRVTAVGVTGSGRKMIGELVGADVVRDEITAQARAAVAADRWVDTVFEIGGQDSKFIFLRDGHVADFRMNKICAAGTGSFVEEQAARLGIPLEEFGPLALSATSPVELGDRCTVFVETAINFALAQGAERADVAAGICQSIVSNYLNRVVANRPVGNRIILQGGVAYNKGIVAAFRQRFGERLSVSPWFAVSGAVGAALLAREAGVGESQFRGFDLSGGVARARSVPDERVLQSRALFKRSGDVLLDDHDPTINPGQKTVGIPRALMVYRLFPLFSTFFRELGYNVMISDESDEEIVRLAQGSAQGEVCYPVKLIHGHMAQLAQRGVDYIFMPSMRTIRAKNACVAHNYACPYMQTAPGLVARELGLERRGIRLLNPVLDLEFQQDAMAKALVGVGVELGHDPAQAQRALLAGSRAVKRFGERSEQIGRELLAGLAEGERVLVLVTRPYGMQDRVLNMGIPELLIERGERVVTLEQLPGHDVDIESLYPSLYWPFGQHILGTAHVIRDDPRLFAVYLTSHGCGPDTMLSHLFAEAMGDKPYLEIEVDEHFSPVGAITRIEAFLNELDHYQPGEARARQAADDPAGHGNRRGGFGAAVSTPSAQDREIDPARPVALPSWGPYGPLVVEWLRGRGCEDVRLYAPDAGAVALGRAETTSKEYLSFAALLGVSLRAIESHDEAVQLLLPANEGAEADGVFERVIQAVLSRRGLLGATTIAPLMERLPFRLGPQALSELFTYLLAGDVCLASDPGERQRLLERLCERGRGGLHFDDVLAAAREVAAGASCGQRQVLVLGEMACVYADELTGGIWQRVERAGWHVGRMPLSECLWFAWADADGDRPRSPGAERDDMRCGELLGELSRRMALVSRALGRRSTFSDDPEVLLRVADGMLGGYRGANGRYRIAKAATAGNACGVIEVASTYENTDIIIRLTEALGDGRRARLGEQPAPIIHVGFDAVLDRTIDEKVFSFLYYL